MRFFGGSATPTDSEDRIRGLNLTVEQVRKYAPSASADASGHAGSSAANTEPETAVKEDGEERVLSFAELKELIEQGKTDQIPHNKKIPDVVNVSPTGLCNSTSIDHTTCSKTHQVSQRRPSGESHGR